MKNLFPFLILFLFISCNTSTTEEKPREEIQETIITSEIPLPFLNKKKELHLGGFQALQTLKKSTIALMKKEPGKQTEILHHFIKMYEENPMPENINSDSFALFYSTEMAEGDFYPAYNSSYLKVGIMELLDEINSRYLSLRCLEIMTKCCDDAAVILKKEEVIQRALHWGELNKKLESNHIFKNRTAAFYKDYKNFLLEGPDNTPAFGFDGIYDSNYFNALKKMIKEHPNSLLADDLKGFVKLLENENFKETNKVKLLIEEM
ncbi:MAG: hypothetical protein ACPG5P_00865, partial [Saprospiraceae bacterium]